MTGCILIAGDSSVGKSVFLGRLMEPSSDVFFLLPPPTIGMVIQILDYKHEDITVKIRFKDVQGAQNMNYLMPSFCRGVDVALVMFDLTARASFESVEQRWVPAIREHAPAHTEILLLANKSDSEPNVTEDEIKDMAARLNISSVFRLSALHEPVATLRKPVQIAALHLIKHGVPRRVHVPRSNPLLLTEQGDCVC